MIIQPESSKTFSSDGTQKTNSFLKLFPDCMNYEIRGFSTRSKITIAPIGIASEGCDEMDYEDGKVLEGAKKVIEQGAPLEVNPVLQSRPVFVHRNPLGQLRWRSSNSMPTCWTIPEE